MSAWLVSRDHIDALVCGAIRYGVSFDGEPVDKENATSVGRRLWDANHKNIYYLYAARHGEERLDDPPYSFIGETGLSPVSLYKQVGCYHYQCCDRFEWEGSPEEKFCQDLEAAILADHGPIDGDNPEYGNAPWGI